VTSVVGTAHALELAAEHDARLVLATSPERVGQGVRCAESLARESMKKTKKLDVRLVRVASTYGPRMPADDPHVVMRFILQALRDDEMSLGLETIHRLAYVGDAVDTLVRTLDADLRMPAVAVPFLDATTSEVARAVLEAASRTDVAMPVTEALPSSAEKPMSSSPTTPEALSATVVFGQPAALELREGVERTVRWFESHFTTLANAQARTSGVFGVKPRLTRRASDEPAA
jgi:nucleoside-diphosphate-sugar epimerase